MAGADGFVKKLADLSPTSVSIQSLSKWCFFFVASAAVLVPVLLFCGCAGLSSHVLVSRQ